MGGYRPPGAGGLRHRASTENRGLSHTIVSDLRRYLPASPTARLVIRVVLAAVCFVVAAILSVMPGPAFVFWIAGLVLLGFSVGQILLSVHAVQELVHRRLPWVERLVPRLRKQHIRRLMRHRWVRRLDRLSGHRERRHRKREERRATARLRRTPTPAE
jgi:hypothetical protein